jgi:hypothetical protein
LVSAALRGGFLFVELRISGDENGRTGTGLALEHSYS